MRSSSELVEPEEVHASLDVFAAQADWKLEPINMRWEDVTLLGEGETYFLRLEPGDGTRYELLVTELTEEQKRAMSFFPDHAVFTVVRVVAGTIIGAIIYAPESYYLPPDTTPISNGNEHTAWMMNLWLREFWQRYKARLEMLVTFGVSAEEILPAKPRT